MNASELFSELGPRLAPLMYAVWDRRDLCIMSTRIAIEVGAYFGVTVEPVAVRLMVMNSQFVSHLDTTPHPTLADLHAWADGSWSVGIGCGKPEPNPNGWDGHLIAASGGYFADFSIRQAERPERNMILGNFVMGPIRGRKWVMECPTTGCQLLYERFETEEYRRAPDWKDANRRRRIEGALIRAIRAALTKNPAAGLAIEGPKQTT